MTWLNPVALAGLVALSIPILVHLFGRRSARRQRFPTLRLLRLSPPTPATRSRPSDILLLVLRCAVIVSAVLALAQPLWPGALRTRDAQTPVRAILVDTSASMRRLTSGGTTALDRARALAERMLDSSREGIIVETSRPAANVAGAASWLGRRSGLRELAIISDFQAGAVNDGNLASIPAGIGVAMLRVDSVLPDAGSTGLPGVGSGTIAAIDPQPDGTRATWRTPDAPPSLPVEVLASAEDSTRVRAMIRAVGEAFPGSSGSDRRVSVVFPGYPGARTLSAQVGVLRASWQGDFLLALRRDELLASVVSAAELTDACQGNGPGIAVNAKQQVVATISAAVGDESLMLFSCAEAGSLAGTALLAAVSSAATAAGPFDEREPSVVPDGTLRGWERPATEIAPRGGEETSPDGRWLWLFAIVLLVVEELLRRQKDRPAMAITREGPHERVA
jgi:hypothetical protein